MIHVQMAPAMFEPRPVPDVDAELPPVMWDSAVHTLADLEERAAADLRRLQVQAVAARRARMSWSIVTHPHVLDVPDLTFHMWPEDCCGARWRVDRADAAADRDLPAVFECTRRAEHTGRHAAGTFACITAVWGDVR